MSEYDYSPGALERYKAQQAKVGRWAADTSSQASQYSHPFPGYTGTTVSSHRPKVPSRSSTLPTHVSSTHSYASSHSSHTARPPSGTVVSRSDTIMAPASHASRSSASRSIAPSHHTSRQGSTVSSASKMSGSSRRSNSISHSGSHVSSSYSGSRHSGSSSYLSGAPSISSRAPTYISGTGVPSVAPSDSISQAGSRSSKRSSTLPSHAGSGHRSVVSSGGNTYLYGPPDKTTTRPFTANGHLVIPAPGQKLDIYYV